MDVIDPGTAWEERAFYFSGKLESPLDIKVWHFRSEEMYDAEEQPEVTAMNLIRDIAKCVGRRPVLILFSDQEPPSALRSRKSVLWGYDELQRLPHIVFEVECGHSKTRLGAVIDLSCFSFRSSSSAVLNWGNGIIVLSMDTLDNVKQLVEHWVSKRSDDVIAFDFDAIANSLHHNVELGVLRYLPPSNSRPETVVVVAEEAFVDQEACRCIDSIAQHHKKPR